MSAKSEAAKQFAQEQELEKLHAAKAAKEAKLAGMTDAERAKYLKKSKAPLIFFLAAVAFFIVIFSMSGGSKDSSAPASPASDSIAKYACQDFHSVINDSSSGILNDAELRTKLVKINDSAQYSTVADIVTASRNVLVADTAGDVTALGVAYAKFQAACAVIGY